ncbi:MAG: PQQ-binding-like beta-propeller repeat protein [Vicinamibacterales bacterium]
MGDRHRPIGRRSRTWVFVALATAIGLAGSQRGSAIVIGSRRQAPAPRWVVAGHARGTPDVRDHVVYFLSRGHEVVALDAQTGVLRWRGSTMGGGEATQGTRVILVGDLLVAGDYDLFGFDRTDGRLRWRLVPEDGFGLGVYLGAACEGAVFAGSPAGRVYAVKAESGGVLWSKLVGSDTTVFAPVPTSDLVVAGFTSFGKTQTGGVVAWDRVSGEERWRRSFPAWNVPAVGTGAAGGPLAAGSWIIASSHEGVIYALDRLTGRVSWVIPNLGQRADGRGPSAQDFRPLAVVGELLVAGSLTGEVVAYELATRRVRWRSVPVSASVAFGLAADDETVYVPYLTGQVVALHVSTGVERWRMGGSAHGFSWVPLVAETGVYLAGSEAGFVALSRPSFP